MRGGGKWKREGKEGAGGEVEEGECGDHGVRSPQSQLVVFLEPARIRTHNCVHPLPLCLFPGTPLRLFLVDPAGSFQTGPKDENSFLYHLLKFSKSKSHEHNIPYMQFFIIFSRPS